MNLFGVISKHRPDIVTYNANNLKQNTMKDLEIKKLKKQNKEMLKALKIALNILDWNDLNDERAIDIRKAVRNAEKSNIQTE